MKIEWASHFRSDGSRRKPPPNVLHGWLAKMRGTLLGDEELRTRGMQEMRAARHYKKSQSTQAKRKPSASRRDTGSSALFGSLNPKPRPVGRAQYRQTSSQRVVGQPPRRPSHHSSRHSNSRPSGSRHGSLPPPQRRQGSFPTPQRRQTAR